MFNPKTYIGRVVELCNLVTKPELNGKFVMVESFDSERERFGVRTLIAPNELNAVAQTLSIKESCIRFREGDTFASRFPDAKVVKASSIVNVIRPGTILDFSKTPAPAAGMLPLIMYKSCLCRGTPSALSNTGEANPVTVIRNDVIIQIKECGGIVEFEDLNFDSLEGIGGVCVTQARHVAFRRCRFHGPFFGAAVGMNEEICLHNEFCHATFESCVFEGNPKGDILVRELAHVTMINCVLHGPKLCVKALVACQFTAIHCRFHGPVEATDKVSFCELINCTIIGSPGNGINLGNGTTARLLGCRVVGCAEDGVVIKGLKKVTAHIEDCVVTECRIGFIFGVGKVDVTLTNTEASNNAFHGLHLCPTLTGTVTLNHCTFTKNRGAMDVVNTRGPECAVIIDGVLQPLGFDRTVMQRAGKDMEQLAANFEKDGPVRISLQQRRSEKQVMYGLVEGICCLNCHTPEPKGVKFKACGKCNEVVYCSRECQVAHWKEHKKECGKVTYI